MTSVWPALWPPWKRTTMSACSDNQSTILPFPSSPHWAPTTTTLAIRSGFPASDQTPGEIRPGPPGCEATQPDKGCGGLKQAGRGLQVIRHYDQGIDFDWTFAANGYRLPSYPGRL